MSVAFRRESDEEHLEPRFELPIPSGPNLVTSRGLALIAARVAELSDAQREESDAERRKAIARDLRYWHTRHATAAVLPPRRDEEAGFGSRVRFRLDGRERVLDLVGHDEADGAGRIAFTAPLALALRGAAAGDLLAFGGREGAIEVVEVGAID